MLGEERIIEERLILFLQPYIIYHFKRCIMLSIPHTVYMFFKKKISFNH